MAPARASFSIIAGRPHCCATASATLIPSHPGMRAGRITRVRSASTGPGTASARPPTRTPAAFSWRLISSMTAARTASGPFAMSMRRLVARPIPRVGSVRATRPWWAPSSTRASAPVPSDVTSRRALRPPVETDSSASAITPASTSRDTAADTVDAASPVCLTIAGRVSA